MLVLVPLLRHYKSSLLMTTVAKNLIVAFGASQKSGSSIIDDE